MSATIIARAFGIPNRCPVARQRLHRTTRTASAWHGKPFSRSTFTRIEAQKNGGLGDEDIDVAVFRFTLGIKGFDDRLIPRVVGLAIAALLALNHVAGAQPTPDAQLRSEWLGLLLAVMCVLVPEIEERLREAMPGRGRQKTAEAIPGAANCFFLEPSLPESTKKELAWCSFALLKNTNCCGLLLVAGDRVLLARGALGSQLVRPGDAERSLAAMSQDYTSVCSTSKISEVASGAVSQLWLPERGDFGGAGMQALAVLPEGAQCLLAQHVAAQSGRPAVLLVFSERPRAMAERERGWVATIADKLSAFV
ncbi:hypothetical protein Agub_g3979 [Astrephomene gubernaculifera]|uniref:Uncharacterized protein n=1 Tax=Astrephomene gubernaculifera TaxID=47775 RepID=A0AAD3HJU0_9CHLO|nr:hypothetical protein Agub_g3979 [Astrephomene gubernaculifera]